MPKNLQFLFWIFVTVASATGCSNVSDPVSPTPMAFEPVSTNTSIPDPTRTPLPSVTATSMPVQIGISDLSPITIENAKNLAEISKLPQSISIKMLAFSPDGKYIFVGCADDSNQAFINIWDLTTGFLIRTLSMEGRFLDDFSISPDGKILATATSGSKPALWNISTGERLEIPDGRDDVPVISVAFKPAGQSLAYGYAMLGFLQIWDLEKQTFLYEVRADTHDVSSISYTLDGQKVISGGWEGTVRIWDANSGNLIKAIDIWNESNDIGAEASVDSYTIVDMASNLRDQIAIAGCGPECIVQIRAINSGELFHQFDLSSGTEWLSSRPEVVFHPAGTMLAIGFCTELDSNYRCAKTTVTLSAMDSFTMIDEIENSGSRLAFSPDGRLLAIGNTDGLVHLFGVVNE